MNGQSERFEMHICPHCGQRNRVQSRAVCAKGEKDFDKMVEDAATALLAGTEIPQTWNDIFAWAYHVGKMEVFPRLEKELEELKADAAKKRVEILRQAIADVANRLRGKEGSIPVVVRARAIEQVVKAAEFNEKTLKMAHGRGLGLEDLRRHLQWLQAQMGSNQKRQTA